jgi:phage host-nuclease inhibitor protein Gam
MARRKLAAVDAPQTLSEALGLLGAYSRLEAMISQAAAEREAGIAKLNDEYTAFAAPLMSELADITRQVKTWYEANRSSLTLDKRKSIDLGGCQIGHRTGNPKLKLPKGMNEVGAIAWLKSIANDDAKWPLSLIRVSEALDKAAMIKALRLDKPSMATMGLIEGGFDTGQREQFFIQSLAPKPETSAEIQPEGCLQ